MGMVRFTVKRNPLPSHDVDDVVDLDIDFREAVRSRTVRKNVHRASGGPTETLYHGADTSWALQLGPFLTADKSAVREFLDSTAEGETFRVWIYDEDESPGTYLDLARTNNGYSFNRIRIARLRDDDMNTVEFQAIEVQP